GSGDPRHQRRLGGDGQRPPQGGRCAVYGGGAQPSGQTWGRGGGGKAAAFRSRARCRAGGGGGTAAGCSVHCPWRARDGTAAARTGAPRTLPSARTTRTGRRRGDNRMNERDNTDVWTAVAIGAIVGIG